MYFSAVMHTLVYTDTQYLYSKMIYYIIFIYINRFYSTSSSSIPQFTNNNRVLHLYNIRHQWWEILSRKHPTIPSTMVIMKNIIPNRGRTNISNIICFFINLYWGWFMTLASPHYPKNFMICVPHVHR